ncbi:MAG: carbohydrate kinase family protein, partial [Anaerolineae bacterium]|nr:carbohydrate kinase family protein [Anaerolineae bacterium]
ARAQGLTTSLDVGWDPVEAWGRNPHLAPTLAHTDFFFPNEVEAAALSADGDYEDLAALLGGLLIVKRGAQGATAYSRDGTALSVPALSVEVIDTTGAGDAFNAGFLYAHRVEGVAVVEAMQFAAACGAQAVTQVGGATGAPTADQVRALLGADQQ